MIPIFASSINPPSLSAGKPWERWHADFGF
jgi:hypothetical protein